MIGTPSQHCGMSLRPKTWDAWDAYSECFPLMKSVKICRIFFVKKEELRKHYRVPGMGVVTVKRLVCFSNQLRKQSIRVVCFLTSWSTETCFLFFFLVFFKPFFRFSFFSNQLHNSPLELFIASPLDCQIYFDFFVSLYPYMFLSLFSFATYCTNSPSEMFVVKLTDISTESFQVAFTTIMDQMLNKILPDWSYWQDQERLIKTDCYFERMCSNVRKSRVIVWGWMFEED